MPHSLRAKLKNLQRKGELTDKDIDRIFKALEQEPSGETVSLEAFKQVVWERNIAIDQLHELGYDFGQKIEPSGDAISRQWLMECINEGWIKFDTEKDTNRFIHLVRDMAPPANLWIPVSSENLPTSEEDVLVTNGIRTYIGWFCHADKCWRVDSAVEYFMNDIIAWMPLPESYKPGGKE